MIFGFMVLWKIFVLLKLLSTIATHIFQHKLALKSVDIFIFIFMIVTCLQDLDVVIKQYYNCNNYNNKEIRNILPHCIDTELSMIRKICLSTGW